MQSREYAYFVRVIPDIAAGFAAQYAHEAATDVACNMNKNIRFA